MLILSILNHEQDHLWESINILSKVDKEKAEAVFKTTIEKSFQQLDIPSTILSQIRLYAPTIDQVSELRQLEKNIRETFDCQKQDVTYELVVDYIDKISTLSKEDSTSTRRKLLASIIAENRRTPKKYRLKTQKGIATLYPATAYVEEKKNYYTTTEVAEKLGLSDQTIRRMCDKGKFKGAYKTEGGHWRIPDHAFITSSDQDKKAEEIFSRIDAKNREMGDINEFDL